MQDRIDVSVGPLRAIPLVDGEVNEMSELSWVLIAVVVLVAVGIVVWLMSRRRRSARLKEHFGPEYERTVGELGEQRAAEADLLQREKKRKKLDIVDLSPEARAEHVVTWQKVQTEFVDAPGEAVGRAERLVTRVMRERGYPIDDFDQRAADISVDHPDVVENYRAAHAISQAQHNGEISTEDARQAFVHYRALFDRLLGSEPETDNQDDGQWRQTRDHA
jgi:type VI protein secretion system component VasK